MSKHTPGPWSAEVYANDMVKVVSGAFSDEAPGICGNYSKDWPLLEDDARLIAAAPDLLAALRALAALDDGDNSTLWPHAKKFARARAAIAKAERRR